MTIQEELQKYGLEAFRSGDRYFLGTRGKIGEFDVNTLAGAGLDVGSIGQVQDWSKYGGVSFEKYGDVNQFLDPMRQRTRNDAEMAAQVSQAQAANAAIASGNVAEVERLNPGYTLWNGAFVQKDLIPQLQKEGATVQGGNVVGPNVAGVGGQPMSPEQKAAVGPQQPQQQQVVGGGSQASMVPGQPDQFDATLGANPMQVGGKFGTMQFGKIGNDVFEIMSDGSRRKVTEAEFNQKLRAQGLNLDVLPQLDLNDNIGDTPGGTPNPDVNPDGTPKGPGDFMSDYKNIIKELGLSDIKAEFEKTKKEYIDLQDKKNAEIADINANPWLSEGIRQTEIRKINTKYELKENTISNQQKLYESMYEEGIAQAKFITSGMQEDRNKMLDLAMKREEAMADLMKVDPSNFKEVRGGLFDIASGKWIIQPETKGGDSGGQGGLYDMFDFRTANALLSEANKFETSDIVKRFNAVVDSTNVINGFNYKTKNPADHQALIYAFAKGLDPDSVVREGEYATIKKYSQALLTRYGKEIQNAISGTGFLSEKAFREIQNTSNLLYKSRLPQYQNAFKATGATIDRISGKPGTSQMVLTDFSAGATPPQDNTRISNTNDPANVAIGDTWNDGETIYLRTGDDEFIPVASSVR